ncbi:MAG: TIGR01841 family phasin [Alphaproteobacteria bacterium]|nr:TIGR01841 family phasin [Alphaproteobacteria bacterium]
MAKTQNSYQKDTKSFSTQPMDFTSMFNEFNRAFGEFGNYFSPANLSMFNMDTFVSVQRRNAEAITTAHQMVFQNVQALVQKQVELAQHAIEELNHMNQNLISAHSPEEKVACHIANTKVVFEQAISNIRELNDMAQKANNEAVNVLTKRFSENLEEIKTVLSKKNSHK